MQLTVPAHHHLVALGETAQDLHLPRRLDARLDRHDLDGAVAADPVDAWPNAQALDRLQWNSQSARAFAGAQNDVGVHAGDEPEVGVRDVDLDVHRARRHLHLVGDPADLFGERLAERVHAHLDALSDADAGDSRLGNGNHQPQQVAF